MGRQRAFGRSKESALVGVAKMKPRIGVLTSGGDCPGLNAVLRGVVLAAEKLGWEVIGFRDGFEGLLRPGDHVVLDRNSTEGIMALGGTIIGTTNRGHLVAKGGAGERTLIPRGVLTPVGSRCTAGSPVARILF